MNLKNNFRREVLSNGATLLFEKRKNSSVSIRITSKKSAEYEEFSEKGISHFIEHMIFEGTKKINALELNEKMDLFGGDFNAFTSDNLISFHCKVHKKFADETLDIIFDLLKNPLFLEKNIKKQKKIISEEIDMCFDDPLDYIDEFFKETLYKGPISQSILGTRKTINSFSRDLFTKYFNDFFNSKNLIFCIVGNYNFKKIKRKIEATFSPKNFSEKAYPKIEKKISRKIEYRKELNQCNGAFSFYSPFPREKEYFPFLILFSLMVQGPSSRLFKEIREKRGLVYDVSGWNLSSEKISFSVIKFGCSKKNFKLIENLILKEFQKVSNSLTQEELNNTKIKMNSYYEIGREDPEETATDLTFFELENGNAEEFYNYPKNIQLVKLEEVRNLAKNILKEGYGFFALLPKK